MIVTVKSEWDVEVVRRELVALGLWVHRIDGARVQLVVEPCSASVSADAVRTIPGVEDVGQARSSTPRVDAQPRVVHAGDARIGVGERPVIMAGPCSVESEEAIFAAAARLSRAGARFLRGGAFKPRTSPYAFQGHGAPALGWLRDAARAHGMGVVTEAMGADEIDLVAAHADLVQIGSRNMHNFALLRVAGACGRPILLKRGMAATLTEWLAAAEYLLVHGAPAVVLCERGIRGFDPSTRNVLDLGAVALLAHVHGLPVIVDPSHASGRRDLVPALSRAALAAGAAGLMIEMHERPGEALSDGPQALLPDQVEALLSEIGS